MSLISEMVLLFSFTFSLNLIRFHSIVFCALFISVLTSWIYKSRRFLKSANACLRSLNVEG